MRAKSKFLLAAAALLGILIMALAGWWVGSLGQSRESPSPAAATSPSPSPEASTLVPLTADLKTDWSNTLNPDPKSPGTWSFNIDNKPLAPVSNWTGMPGTAGWGSPANIPGNFLPFIYQAPADGIPGDPNGSDFKAGDILLHANDPSNGPHDGEATISWTSAISGTTSVSGALWPVRNINRENTFQLVFHTANAAPVTITTSTLPENGTLSRNHPAVFEAPPMAIHKGDSFQLTLSRSPNSISDFAAINFTITTTPTAPPPSSPASPWRAEEPRPAISAGLPALLISLAALALATLALAGVILLLWRRSNPNAASSTKG